MQIPEARVERYGPGPRVALSVLACMLTTLIATALSGLLDQANIVMLFLLTVLLIAFSLGRDAAVVAAVLGVVLFDVFFVAPRFSLAVSNLQYLVTFAVMLTTGLLTAHLAANLKGQAQAAEVREQRTRALYEVARKLAGAMSFDQTADIVRAFVHSDLGGTACLRTNDGSPGARQADAASWFDASLASRARESATVVRDPGSPGCIYLPLTAPMQVRGVLAVRMPDVPRIHRRDDEALLQALASLVAIAIERLHYVEVAQRTELDMATERLRSSILSALSHDLRTPLTVLVGLADSLSLVDPPLHGRARGTADALRAQASHVAGIVTNLLEMARLSAGPVRLRKEWQPLEEVVGSSLKLLSSALDGHPVEVDLPPDLPLVHFDAVLIERVLCNLLENAAKYAPADTGIRISARIRGDWIEVAVCDRGPGLAPDGDEGLFEMFARGRTDSDKPGTGLGLAICRSIVEAHGGSIRAETRAEGSCLVFGLPRGIPPILEAEDA